MALYKGFSTVSPLAQKKYVLTGTDLIKQDLLNIINTPRGSRVMQPNKGCVAWEKLFEPINTSMVEDISSNLTSIFSSDPRVNLQSVDISQNDHTIIAQVKFSYSDTNELDEMTIVFDTQSAQY